MPPPTHTILRIAHEHDHNPTPIYTGKALSNQLAFRDPIPRWYIHLRWFFHTSLVVARNNQNILAQPRFRFYQTFPYLISHTTQLLQKKFIKIMLVLQHRLFLKHLNSYNLNQQIYTTAKHQWIECEIHNWYGIPSWSPNSFIYIGISMSTSKCKDIAGQSAMASLSVILWAPSVTKCILENQIQFMMDNLIIFRWIYAVPWLFQRKIGRPDLDFRKGCQSDLVLSIKNLAAGGKLHSKANFLLDLVSKRSPSLVWTSVSSRLCNPDYVLATTPFTFEAMQPFVSCMPSLLGLALVCMLRG